MGYTFEQQSAVINAYLDAQPTSWWRVEAVLWLVSGTEHDGALAAALERALSEQRAVSDAELLEVARLTGAEALPEPLLPPESREPWGFYSPVNRPAPSGPFVSCATCLFDRDGSLPPAGSAGGET